MNKLAKVAVVIGLVIILYLVLLVVMPVLNSVISTANATINSTSNLTLYPGGSEILVAAPWFLWFVPGGIGMVVVIFILKQP